MAAESRLVFAQSRSAVLRAIAGGRCDSGSTMNQRPAMRTIFGLAQREGGPGLAGRTCGEDSRVVCVGTESQ